MADKNTTDIGEIVVTGTREPNPWDVATSGENYGGEPPGSKMGPLSDLYRNPYKSTAIGYPKDLGFLNKGHVIQFDIREIIPAKFEVLEQAVENATNAGQEFLNNAIQNPAGTVSGLVQGGSAIAEQIQGAVSSVIEQGFGGAYTNLKTGLNSAGNIKWTPETYSDKVETIRMYMPDTLNFSYGAQYDKLSLAEAINSVPLVGKVSTAITSILENRAVKLATNKLGYTFNPQQQMMFEGIDFREFDLQFTFTPTSAGEAKAMRDIIRTLRLAAAPERKTASGGFFFVPPSVFEISFFFEGEHNTNIAPIRPCVLQNISVDYAPNGWSALRDGTPVQTTIALSFKEIELIDKNSIKDEKK